MKKINISIIHFDLRKLINTIKQYSEGVPKLNGSKRNFVFINNS